MCPIYYGGSQEAKEDLYMTKGHPKMCQAWGKYRTPKMHFKQIIGQTPSTTLLAPWGRLQWRKDNDGFKYCSYIEDFTFWLHHHQTPWHPLHWCCLQHWSPDNNLINRSSSRLCINITSRRCFEVPGLGSGDPARFLSLSPGSGVCRLLLLPGS